MSVNGEVWITIPKHFTSPSTWFKGIDRRVEARPETKFQLNVWKHSDQRGQPTVFGNIENCQLWKANFRNRCYHSMWCSWKLLVNRDKKATIVDTAVDRIRIEREERKRQQKRYLKEREQKVAGFCQWSFFLRLCKWLWRRNHHSQSERTCDLRGEICLPNQSDPFNAVLQVMRWMALWVRIELRPVERAARNTDVPQSELRCAFKANPLHKLKLQSEKSKMTSLIISELYIILFA